MANTFKVKSNAAMPSSSGTPDTIYTCGASGGTVILGLVLANVHTSSVTASVKLESNTNLKSKFKIANPRIKILGLNPHAGENGKIGKEELDHIRPAVIDLRKDKIDVSMPVSADTAFSLNSLKETDAFLGMYHDQVLPVLKALSFGNSINVTLGVPIIRTSVDHGVALDIAGTNRSDTSSLSLAIKTAKKLIR